MITIAMNAWPRFQERVDYFTETVTRFRKWAKSPAPVKWVVAVETQDNDPDSASNLSAFCQQNGIEMVWHEGPPDIAANQNLLFRTVRTKYAMYLQEDWYLHSPLDMLTDVVVMEDHGYDMVQYVWDFTPPEADIGNVFYVNDAEYHEIGKKQTWYYRDNPYIVNVRSLGKVGSFTEQNGVLGEASEYNFACRSRDILKVAGRGDGVYNRFFTHGGIKSSMIEKWQEYWRLYHAGDPRFRKPVGGTDVSNNPA